ncbi:50S ribosomal protein L18 [gamma proteobacterium HdN1]|nr:50S ribosomal protein L18 [gamma proteobacterium HdN1]
MNAKKVARVRRAKKTRLRVRELGQVRLAVHRTGQHIYAQVISGCGGKIIAAASTVEAGFGALGSNKQAAASVGKLIAERAREKGIEKVAFDRSGFKYHGRIQALADAARESGLQF